MREAGAASPRWGFIGSGQMAGALVGGLVRSGAVAPASVLASDPVAAARDALVRTIGIAVTDSNRDVARGSEVLVLAVKPQAMADVLAELRPEVEPRHLVISIAAGVSLAVLRAGLGPACRLIRVMPNTPALVGAAASAYCLDARATDDDEQLVRGCLESVGRAVRVEEPLLDAVTGLSGSGPAFVFLVIEALSDGGVRAGLPRGVATTLAAQTVLGAARLVLETGQHPGVLKDQVASPGGTTIAGLHALETGGLRGTLMNAVLAAARRSAELSGAPPAAESNPRGKP
jgi:pyrroline-5-carboxylate reductase